LSILRRSGMKRRRMPIGSVGQDSDADIPKEHFADLARHRRVAFINSLATDLKPIQACRRLSYLDTRVRPRTGTDLLFPPALFAAWKRRSIQWPTASSGRAGVSRVMVGWALPSHVDSVLGLIVNLSGVFQRNGGHLL
jgi:hypothetical protein